MGVTKTTMLLPMIPMGMVRPTSADSVGSFIISHSNQIGFPVDNCITSEHVT